MNIQIPESLALEISKLVEAGIYPTSEVAISKLLSSALQKRTNKSSGRFLYSEPIFTSEEISGEEWRAFPLPEFPVYEISNLGRVRSLRFGAKFIKLSPQTNGYRQAPVVSASGKKSFPLVQRLVAAAFLPAVPGKIEVNHKNGNKADNRLSNLEWLSAAENSKHAIDAGLRHWRGAHHRSKIAEADVRTIRAAKSEDATSLSEKYGISRTQIRSIQEGKAWEHIK